MKHKKKSLSTHAEAQPQASKALAGNHGFSLISDRKLLDLHHSMLRLRAAAEFAAKLNPKTLDVVGLEATAVGSIIDMEKGDTLVLPPLQAHFALLAKASLARILAVQQAASESMQGVFDPIEIALALEEWQVYAPSGSTRALLHRAIGAALQAKLSHAHKIAIVLLPHEAAQDRVLADALKLADKQALPLLFVLQHQRSVPSTEVPAPLAEAIEQCEFPAITVDGDDAVAIYRVATESIERIRQDRGPTLIQCLYAPAFDLNEKITDPIARMERYLERKGLFKPDRSRHELDQFYGHLKVASAEHESYHEGLTLTNQ